MLPRSRKGSKVQLIAFYYQGVKVLVYIDALLRNLKPMGEPPFIFMYVSIRKGIASGRTNKYGSK